MSDFLYEFCKCGKWKLILASNFVCARKNYYEPLMNAVHVATGHGVVVKIMQSVTDRYQSHSSSAPEGSFVVSCDTCQGVKQSNQPPLGPVIPLHVPVRPWTDM